MGHYAGLTSQNTRVPWGFYMGLIGLCGPRKIDTEFGVHCNCSLISAKGNSSVVGLGGHAAVRVLQFKWWLGGYPKRETPKPKALKP